MLASMRLVIVREVDAMPRQQLEKLTDYLDDPSPEHLRRALRRKARRPHQARQARAEARPGGRCGAAQAGRSAQLRDERGAAPQAARSRRDAAAALVDAIGNDLPAIDDALERLALYVGETPNDRPGRGRSVRDQGAGRVDLGAGRRGLACATGAPRFARPTSLLADREPPLRILAMVARQLRIVSRMRRRWPPALPPQDAAKEAGAPPFKARDLAAAARRFDRHALAHAFAVLAEADLALKGSKRPADIVLQAAILAPPDGSIAPARELLP